MPAIINAKKHNPLEKIIDVSQIRSKKKLYGFAFNKYLTKTWIDSSNKNALVVMFYQLYTNFRLNNIQSFLLKQN